MAGTKDNPEYTVFIVSSTAKYDVTEALVSIDLSEQEKQMAASATIDIMNVQVNGKWFNNLPKVRDRVFIYADDGEKKDEVFRGFIWSYRYRGALTDRTLQLKCYDNLIYFQESEDSEFFASGKSTKDVLSALCKKWGVQLEYSYESITHSKLALRGTLADIFTDDVLDLVKDRTGKKYVILSTKDVLQIKGVGTNNRIYTVGETQNAISTSSYLTMDDVVTQVKVLGKADDDDRRPVEATVSGKTDRYGTLQKLIDRDENTSLADAKKEAQNIIDDKGAPKWEHEVKTVDIPWIRKGDQVIVNAGDIAQKTLIVVGISRDISATSKTMTLTLEPK